MLKRENLRKTRRKKSRFICLIQTSTHTVCPWKGTASYYSVEVNGEENKDAAWYYPETSELAKNIKGYVAFWNGVKVEN